jgi:hypothetical protein
MRSSRMPLPRASGNSAGDELGATRLCAHGRRRYLFELCT